MQGPCWMGDPLLALPSGEGHGLGGLGQPLLHCACAEEAGHHFLQPASAGVVEHSGWPWLPGDLCLEGHGDRKLCVDQGAHRDEEQGRCAAEVHGHD